MKPIFFLFVVGEILIKIFLFFFGSGLNLNELYFFYPSNTIDFFFFLFFVGGGILIKPFFFFFVHTI